ncbi:MAG: RNA polymerase sigma-70 factor [Bacteroidales bacterium]|nr:RNA polymerase sigma-70 factor [Bacteroidales bacterium]
MTSWVMRMPPMSGMKIRNRSSHDMDERQLIALLREGDSLSFEILFQKYYVRFYNFCRNLIKDSHAAEDIVQNVFMKVWVNRKNLHPDQSIHNYIYVLTKHEVLNHIRDRRVCLQVEQLIMSDQPSASITDEMFSFRELDERVRRFIASMPGQRRKVFLLSRYRGMSNKAIADLLGLSVKTVDRHINLALTSLRKEFMKNIG